MWHRAVPLFFAIIIKSAYVVFLAPYHTIRACLIIGSWYTLGKFKKHNKQQQQKANNKGKSNIYNTKFQTAGTILKALDRFFFLRWLINTTLIAR